MRLMVLPLTVVLVFVLTVSCVSDDSSADMVDYIEKDCKLIILSDIPDFDEDDSREWDARLESAKSIVVYEGVRSIGDYAFSGFTNVTSIITPSTLEHIGTHSFADCVSLTALNIGSDVICEEDAFYRAGVSGTGVAVTYHDIVSSVNRAFWGSENIVSVDLGNVKSIGDMAFYGMEGVEFRIPSTITSFGSLAMYGCTGIVDLVLGKDVTYIGADAFKGCPALQDVTFQAEDCDDLIGGVFGDTGTDMSFAIGSPCTHIPSYLFEGADIGQLTISDSVTSIGKHAFRGFDGPSVVLPSNLETIHDEAFLNCTSLSSVILSGSVTSIGKGAFDGCSNLTEIVFSASISDISSDGTFFDDTGSSDVEVEVTGITRVPANLFMGFSGMASVTLGNGVTEIGPSAFASCISLTSVDLSDVIFIGEQAFEGCLGLSDVTFTSSELEIGSMAFLGCDLDSIELSDVSVGDSAFGGNVPETIVFNGSLVCADDPFPGLEGTVITFMDDDMSFDPGAVFSDCDDVMMVFRSDSIPEGLLASFPGSFSADIFSEEIGNGAFEGCTDLSGIVLRDGVITIGDRAFDGCTAIRNMTVPASVTEIGSSAFSGLSSLSSLNYHASDVIVRLGHEPFLDSGVSGGMTVSIEGDVPGRLFSGSPSPRISDVVFIGTVVIGDRAFEGVDLDTISLPSSLRLIGEYAFSRTSISELALHDEISLSEGAFSGCEDLVSVDLTGLTWIPDLLFSGCTSLEDIVFDPSVSSIGDGAFSGTCPTDLQFPYSLTYIGRGAFEDCTSLEHLTLLGHDVTIGDRAFRGCDLRVVEMQEGTVLGEGVFSFDSGTRVLMAGCPVGTVISGCIVYPSQGMGAEVVRYDVSSLGLSDILLFDGTVIDAGLIDPHREFTGWVYEDGTEHIIGSDLGEVTLYGTWVGSDYDVPEEPAVDPRVFDVLAWAFMLVALSCTVLVAVTKRSP